MGMFDNEVAVDNRMREYERLSKAPGGKLVSGAEVVAGVVGAVSCSSGVSLISGALGIAKRFTGGIGVATIEENLDHLGRSTEAAILRVEEKLSAQGASVEEVRERIESPEFADGIASAVLHSQRTKQKNRLERMARILANGVAENDIEPESLDDMLRAAVELTEGDIRLLGRLYRSQRHILDNNDHRPFSHQWYEQVGAAWESEFVRSEREHLSLRASLMRLRSLGMVAETGASLNGEFAKQHFGLLPDGKKFYERLQEIGTAE